MNNLQEEAKKINKECLTFPNAFMVKIENEISHINKRLDDIPTKSEMMLANEKMLNRVLEKADTKYAPKHIEDKIRMLERVVYFGVGGCLIFVLNSLLDLI